MTSLIFSSPTSLPSDVVTKAIADKQAETDKALTLAEKVATLVALKGKASLVTSSEFAIVAQDAIEAGLNDATKRIRDFVALKNQIAVLGIDVQSRFVEFLEQIDVAKEEVQIDGSPRIVRLPFSGEVKTTNYRPDAKPEVCKELDKAFTGLQAATNRGDVKAGAYAFAAIYADGFVRVETGASRELKSAAHRAYQELKARKEEAIAEFVPLTEGCSC